MKRRIDQHVNVNQPEQLALLADRGQNDEGTVQNPRALYRVLTNRNNLLDILSSGWIRPPVCYVTYFDDPGQYAPNGVVLLREDPSEDLCARTVGDDPAIFPVLLDVDLTGLDGEGPVIGPDYSATVAPISLAGRALVVVCRGLIPSSRVVSVHFRSKSDLQEHRARRYGNVRSEEIPLHVSPYRFHGPLIDVDLLTMRLMDANGLIAPADPSLVRQAGALGGALLMLAAVIERQPDLTLALLLPPLRTLMKPDPSAADFPVGDSPEQDILQRALGVLPELLLPPDGSARSSDAGGARLVELARRSGEQTHLGGAADVLLFLVAADVLAHAIHEDYYAEAALEMIRGQFDSLLPRLLAGEAAERRDEAHDALLDRMRAVLNGTADVADFPHDAKPVAEGLLRFLQRGTPDGVLSWLEEDPRPSAHALVFTALLAGILHGRERIPVAIRPASAYCRRVDEAICWRVNRSVGGLIPWDDHGNFEVEGPAIDTSRPTVLTWGREVIVTQQSIPSPEFSGRDKHSRMAKLEAGGAEPDSDQMRRRQKEQGTGSLGRRTRDALLTTDLKRGPGRDASIRLCELMEWHDCLTTVFLLDSPELFLRTAQDGHRVELRVPGVIAPGTHDLRDREFRNRLDSIAPEDVPEQVWIEIADALSGSGSANSSRRRVGSPPLASRKEAAQGEEMR